MVTMAANGLAVGNSIPEDYMENGRAYHGYRKGMYMYPCDEKEKDRMDLFHQLFLVARRGALHQPNLTNSNETRILDLGTGTGIWAIDMADKFNQAEVVGLDLANIQPERIPPNLRFRVPRDFESIWSLGEESWDLIHLRQGCGSVSSWPELYQKIFAHLKPGHGYIEQVEIDFRPRCDDGSLPYAPIVQWYDELERATQQVARPIAYQQHTRMMLERAGFVDIQEQIIKTPYNSWPKDPHQKQIGRWYSLGLSDYIEALTIAPMTRVAGWDVKAIKEMVENVRRKILTKKVHGYNNIEETEDLKACDPDSELNC